jgi:hypothetical protein
LATTSNQKLQEYQSGNNIDAKKSLRSENKEERKEQMRNKEMIEK